MRERETRLENIHAYRNLVHARTVYTRPFFPPPQKWPGNEAATEGQTLSLPLGSLGFSVGFVGFIRSRSWWSTGSFGRGLAVIWARPGAGGRWVHSARPLVREPSSSFLEVIISRCYAYVPGTHARMLELEGLA